MNGPGNRGATAGLPRIKSIDKGTVMLKNIKFYLLLR